MKLARSRGRPGHDDNRLLPQLQPEKNLPSAILVAQYERLFGRASHEVCKEAAAALIASLPRADVPQSLLA